MTKHKVIGKSGYEYVSSYDEIVNHTIERCAQIAIERANRSFSDLTQIEQHYVLLDVADEIRKLKDKI